MSQQRTQMVRDQEHKASQARELRPVEDLVDYAQNYAKERPEMVALLCLGVGFILGWRLKPW